MNAKDIPPQVLEWLIEQHRKDKVFSIYLTPEYIELSDGEKDFQLISAYRDGSLLDHLGHIGYREKSWLEHHTDDEMLRAEYDISDEDYSLHPIQFLKRIGLVNKLSNSMYIFFGPNKEEGVNR